MCGDGRMGSLEAFAEMAQAGARPRIRARPGQGTLGLFPGLSPGLSPGLGLRCLVADGPSMHG